MHVVQKVQELNRALESQSASTISQYTGKIKDLIGEKCVFIYQKEAFIAKRVEVDAGKIFMVSLMAHCRDKKSTGERMTDAEIGAFIKAGGEIKLTN